MWLKYCLVLLCSAAVLSETVDYKTELKHQLHEHIKNDRKSSSLQEFLSSFSLKHAFRQLPYVKADELLCETCQAVVDAAIQERLDGLQTEDIIQLVVDVCVLLDIESLPVCEGAIRLNAEPVIYIIDNRPELNGQIICGTVLGCDGAPVQEWNVVIPPGGFDKEKGLESDSDHIKVVQVTDTHFDPNYQAGSLGNCDEPLCCQAGSVAENPEDAAGYWGDYRDCDSPRHLILNAYEHIISEHGDADYIYFTGDIIRHKIWDTSIEANTQDMTTIFDDFDRYFPVTPIYPTMGNHEGQPVNQFAPPSVTDPSVSSQWLYDVSAELWGRWLPEDAKTTIRQGGYYSVLVRPGFRVIAFNSNIYQRLNFWLLYESDFQTTQLQWLVDELYKAENNGEFVHILHHMPTAYGYITFSRWWRRILERFENTITAVFNGDSHNDEYVVFHHADEPTKAIHVAWNGGSLTTYSNHNYNYKVYNVDGENFEVLDFESWTFNLTEANLTPELPPNWFKLYSFKDTFGMDNLSPTAMRGLLHRMTQNHDLLQLDYTHRYRGADSRGPCNESCMRGNLCAMVRMEDGDSTVCDELLSMWSSEK